MEKIWFCAMAAALVSIGAAKTASAQPSQVTIRNFTHGGSGCPAGSVGANISAHGESVILLFDSFIAKTPPGNIDRKNCQIAIDLDFDSAFSFTVFRVDYRGFAGLKAGARGEQKSTYFFQGVPPAGDASAQTTLIGPFFEDYSRSDDVGLLVWSPCNGRSHALVINSQVRVLGAEGQMTVDSITGKVSQVYDLQWRKCH